MATETITLVISAATLLVTSWMLIYMKKSDRIKSEKAEKLRKKEINAQIERKEKELKQTRLMASLSGSGVGQQQIDKNEYDLAELRSKK